MTGSRTSRVLFLAALVALAAFAFLELPNRRSAEREQAAARRLFPPFAAMIDRVEILRPDARVVLEARATHWEMVEPVRDAAEYSRIATLISTIENATVERNLGPTEDPAGYGLAPAAVVLCMTSGADTVARLEVGALTVDRAFAYARRDDGDVILVPPTVLSASTPPVDAFRDQNLIRFDIAEVAAFAVRREHSSNRWKRRGAETWFSVVAGDTVRGDSIAVPALLRRFRGMRVRAFVEPQDTAGAFTDPSAVLTLYQRAPAPPVTIRFKERPAGTYWARVDGHARVVDVHGDVASALDASPATLRDRRLLQFAPARARRIHIVTPDTSAVLVRAGDAWALPNPALGIIDRGAATDFIRALRTLRYTRLVEAAPHDVEPATFALLIAAENDTILDELRGRPSKNTSEVWIVTSRSLRTFAELPATELYAVIARLRRLRDASPSHTPLQ